MKLKEALELAYECGLETVGEAINNVEFHALNLFSYEEVGQELKELYKELKYYEVNEKDRVEDVLKKLLKCSWCDCSEGKHEEYRECPLFDGDLICDICCDYDILGWNSETNNYAVAEAIKKKTGKEVSEQEIIDTCIKCGKSLLIKVLGW